MADKENLLYSAQSILDRKKIITRKDRGLIGRALFNAYNQGYNEGYEDGIKRINMTNDEAIELLRNIKVTDSGEFEDLGTWWGGMSEDYANAIALAIKALKEREIDIT